MNPLLSQLSEQLSFWHWWILAVVFIILEIFSPAAFFLWLGIAAAVTGITSLIAPEIHWTIQFLTFSVLSILSVLLGRIWFKRHPIDSDQPFLNDPNAQLVGRICEVEQAIRNGSGRVKIADTTWKALGPDANTGDKVRVTGIRSASLLIERVD